MPRELVAVISDRLWRTRYGADPGVVGRALLLNDEPYTVVGVMPPGFQYPDDVDVWQRLRWDLTQHSREAHFMEAVARLKPGTSVSEAQAAEDALASRLASDFPVTNKGWGRRVIPLLDEQLGYYRPALMVLFGAMFAYAGWLFLQRASRFSTPALGMPNLIWYLPAIVGMLLMLLVAIDRAATAIASGGKDEAAS